MAIIENKQINIEKTDLGYYGVRRSFLNSISFRTGKREFERGDIKGNFLIINSKTPIQKAIDKLDARGGGTLFLRAGTYTVGTALTGISAIQIIGENKSTTIVDFNNTSANLSFTGTSVYSTGTITSISGGVTVTGSGTAWLANVTTDHQFFIAQRWYRIASVDSDTQITLSEGYVGGATFPGSAYRAAIIKKDIEISEITFKNSTGTALALTDCRDIFMEDVEFLDNNKGFTFDNVSEYVLDRVNSISNTSNGWEMNTCGFANVRALNSSSNGGHGGVMSSCRILPISFSAANANTSDGINVTSCTDCFLEVEVSSNGGQGIELVSGNDRIVLFTCLANSNTSDGIKLTATSDRCKIISGHFGSNGGYGVNIAASSNDNNIVALNTFQSNTSGTIQDLGTLTVSANNN